MQLAVAVAGSTRSENSGLGGEVVFKEYATVMAENEEVVLEGKASWLLYLGEAGLGW